MWFEFKIFFFQALKQKDRQIGFRCIFLRDIYEILFFFQGWVYIWFRSENKKNEGKKTIEQKFANANFVIFFTCNKIMIIN